VRGLVSLALSGANRLCAFCVKALAALGANRLALVGIFYPLTVEDGVLGYLIRVKAPSLAKRLILIPAAEGVAFPLGIGRLCNEAALLDSLRGNAYTVARDEINCVFFILGVEYTAEKIAGRKR
jgi:hypothetical protein